MCVRFDGLRAAPRICTYLDDPTVRFTSQRTNYAAGSNPSGWFWDCCPAFCFEGFQDCVQHFLGSEAILE